MNVAITGMNNKPDNPGPGHAVARCIRGCRAFTGKIIGLGYDVLDGGLYDDVCDAGYLLPYPSRGTKPFLNRLRTITNHVDIDVIIPCLDAELPAFAEMRDELTTMGIRSFLPDRQQLQARDKDRLPELCAAAGVETPEIKHVTSEDYFYRCSNEGWGYPLVIKGIFYDALIAYKPQQAVELFRKIAHEWGVPVLVQKFLVGDEFNLAGLGDGNGNMLGAVMMRKHGLTDKGKAWAGMSIDDPELIAAAEKLVRKLKWSGPLEVEMLRDKDGKLHLLEINPRFPAWIYLSHGVDCNLPAALLQWICEEDPVVLKRPRAGHLFIRYAQELVINLEQFEAMTMYGGLHPETPIPISVG
ncbi:MAG: carbamoyl-phosphate-synthetase, partial [Gammaproteobacteria bacterium]|nr:carbamoyl-phosphate-synthetase [Gammaproteobacteria bacterium]